VVMMLRSSYVAFWLCWFVVLRDGFHGGADIGSFVVVPVVVLGGDARGDCVGFWW